MSAEFEKWLVGTVWGIILLGAIGSLLAIPAARGINWAYNKWVKERLKRWLLSNAFRFIAPYFETIMRHEMYLKYGRLHAIQIEITETLVKHYIYLALFIGSLVLNTSYFYAYGVSNTPIAVGLIIFTLLNLRDVFNSVMMVLAIKKVHSGNIEDRVKAFAGALFKKISTGGGAGVPESVTPKEVEAFNNAYKLLYPNELENNRELDAMLENIKQKIDTNS